MLKQVQHDEQQITKGTIKKHNSPKTGKLNSNRLLHFVRDDFKNQKVILKKQSD